MISSKSLLKAIVLAVVTICMLALCPGHEAVAQTIPEKFISAKDMKKVQTTNSGLRYLDVVEGTGAVPLKGQKVSVQYTGWLTTGEVFDSSIPRGAPFTYYHRVSHLIPGWNEAVNTMKVGGKRKLIIPPRLGYGSDGSGAIPPNSTLLFEIELLSAEGATMN